MRLPLGSSKQEEINHYRAFVADLPADSYLYSILRDTTGEVERMINSDLAFSQPLHQLWERHREVLERLATIAKATLEGQRQLTRLTRILDIKTGELRDLATAAEHIAKVIRGKV